MSNNRKGFYEFGSFRLDPSEQRLWRDGAEIALTPKAFGVLLMLVRNSDHTLTKDDFMKEVWPDSFVEESNLADNISTLRKTLGDDAKAPMYIETVPRRGYRFVADVTELQSEDIEFVVAEHTRAHILIEEDDETSNTVSKTGELAANESAALRATPRARPNVAWKLRPAVLATVVLILGGALVAAIYFLRASRPQPAPAINSIAVLPFKPLVANDRNESLEMGMADTLITRLSSISRIAVRPMSAARKYTRLEDETVRAGQELMVDAVLDGSIQKVGDQIRVSVRLIRVEQGQSIWAEQFDEKFTDIFAVQDAISRRVASILALKLGGEERERLAKRETENTEAYQLYLQGRLFQGKRTVADVRRAIGYFQQAIELDHNYALPYSGLADCYHLLAFYGELSPQEAYPQAKRAALKALEIDPAQAEAHTSLARIKSSYDRDAKGAEEDFRRAIELNPNYAPAHHWYSTHLLGQGRVDEALIEAKKAQELDPLSLIINSSLAEILYFARRFDDALKYLRRVREVDPNFHKTFVTTFLYLTYMRKEMYEEAILENARRLADNLGPEKEAEAAAALRTAYVTAGERGIWQKQIELAEKMKKGDRDLPLFMGEAYTRLGERDQAFAWLNKAADERHPAMMFISLDPDFESLHADPRFAELVGRAGSAR